VDESRLEYGFDAARLPTTLHDRFVRLELDDAARAFLARGAEAPHSALRTSAQKILRAFFSDFDANALLGMYPMHLVSTAQAEKLLGGRPGGALLDVGAGDGGVTAQIAPLFDEVFATEMSRAMAWRLRRRGFECRRVDLAPAADDGRRFRVVSLLNVLDRCRLPATLLRRAAEYLEPGGRLLVALALPYLAHYYVGPATPPPEERLAIEGTSWEARLASFVDSVLRPIGLRPAAISRAPYLSHPDSTRTVGVLDDAVVVASREGT